MKDAGFLYEELCCVIVGAPFTYVACRSPGANDEADREIRGDIVPEDANLPFINKKIKSNQDVVQVNPINFLRGGICFIYL